MPNRGEPPFIEGARRIGWLFLALASGAMLWGKFGTMPRLAAGLAIGCGILGLLAIINVALVRALYAQLPTTTPDGDGAGVAADRADDAL